MAEMKALQLVGWMGEQMVAMTEHKTAPLWDSEKEHHSVDQMEQLMETKMGLKTAHKRELKLETSKAYS